MPSTPTGPYVALTSGDRSLVVLETEVASHLAAWMPLSDRFPDTFSAYAYAARLGYLPETWEDSMTPIRMSAALPLYRSVSPGELASILTTGRVTGRGNRFNDHERRSFVFLGDAPTDRLVGQGEMLDRQLGESVWHGEGYADLFDQIERDDAALKKQCAQARDAIDQARSRRRRGDPFVDATSPELTAARSALGELSRRRTALQADFRTTVWRRIEERQAFLAGAHFTSVVLRFEPTDRGFHYSPRHGRSGMGEEDEYGFFPGTLQWSYGVDQVGWVKDGRILEWTAPDTAFERSAEFHQRLEGSAPRSPALKLA